MYFQKLPNAAATKPVVTNTATLLNNLLTTAAGTFVDMGQSDSIILLPEDGAIRILCDGNIPTATNGFLLQQGITYSFTSIQLNELRLIRVGGANVTCSVQIGTAETGEGLALGGGSAGGGGGMAIGGAVAGGTIGSVLFIGAGATLAQDNPNFFWDDATNFLGLGINTPTERLHVLGNAIVDGKLTVTGAIDPTSVLLSGGTALFYESNNGSTAPVSGAATGRLRYNNVANAWQVSTQGSAYANLALASATSLQTAYNGGATITTSLANGPVAITNPAATAQTAVTIVQNTAGQLGLSVTGGQISSPGAGANSERFGLGSVATGADSVVLGNGASSSVGGTDTVIIGKNASGTFANGVAIGSGATLTALDTVVIGKSATASVLGGVAIGDSASVQNGVALGQNAGAGNTDAIAIGNGATCNQFNSMAIGHNATVSAAHSLAIGYQATCTSSLAIAIGRVAEGKLPNSFVAGSGDIAMENVYFGKGINHVTPGDYVIRGTAGQLPGSAGGGIGIAGGRSGDNATVGGACTLQASVAGSATVSTIHVTVQNGLTTINSNAAFAQGQSVATTTKVAAYVILATDYVIFADTTGGAFAVTLPDPAVVLAGKSYRIKDSGGAAAANNITVNTTAGNIDGAATFVMNVNYGSGTFTTNGSNWFVV